MQLRRVKYFLGQERKWLCAWTGGVFLVHEVQRQVIDQCIVLNESRQFIADNAERFALKLRLEAFASCSGHGTGYYLYVDTGVVSELE